eukprot:CAMPEP_0172487460 /NCGR_PEP_ID=MMETSP1066-20121228/16572_1 /TAXON_ID=671091 /ORGANISM="Coscinodiscus wailesii, Strain CCMP2513" /LENGTH=449 /DNA_ID=CAMNT_0013254097 /DNA_START=323 /DNA_END=1669 /DNA_ORIENTATION=+
MVFLFAPTDFRRHDQYPFITGTVPTASAAVTAPATTTGEKTGIDPELLSSAMRQRHESSVLDEVWKLVDKYYIDRTFNGQDWNAVRETYVEKDEATTGRTPERSMSLASEMVASLGDKYSRVLDAASYNRIQKYDLIGVGATLMPDADKRIMVGAPPVPGSAAATADLRYGDYIVKVNGVSTEGRTSFDIIDQINENPNMSSLTFTIYREGPDDIKGEGMVRDVTLARTFMEVKNPIDYKITERRGDGTVVGYIKVKEFNALVQKSLMAALSDLELQGANAYVLDLRGNPGGAFQSAVEISSLFLKDRVATYVVDNNDVELPFRTTKDKVIVDVSEPLVIWVDGRSASASEVLAGALKDNCRAVVMGQKSFGKGLIQAVYGLKNGSGLVLTVAKYVTPNGTDIQGTGISPDVEGGVPLSFIPKISEDTSKVDFRGVIANKLDMCTVNSR